MLHACRSLAAIRYNVQSPPLNGIFHFSLLSISFVTPLTLFLLQFTRKSCESLGIEYELRQVGAARNSLGDQPNVSIGVEEAILEANEDDEVDGIMVYYPIHGGSQDQYLQQCVSPYKDVEGLNHKFLFNLYHK